MLQVRVSCTGKLTFLSVHICQVLISRNYRGDLDMGIIDKFMPLVMDREEEGNITPIIQHGGVTFSFIKYNNLYLVSVTKKNANVAMVFQFLHKVVQVLYLFVVLFQTASNY